MFFSTILISFVPTLAASEIRNEIEVIPPMNWKANDTNNSTSMIWFQNSTKSVFAIIKAPDKLTFPLFLAGPFMTQYLKYKGLLESSDQLNFGRNNHGYRYFLNLSSPSTLLDSSSGLIPAKDFLQEIPEGYDIPYKGMMILTEKHGELFAIIFLNPKENFESALNEIKPSLDSIQLTSYTKMESKDLFDVFLPVVEEMIRSINITDTGLPDSDSASNEFPELLPCQKLLRLESFDNLTRICIAMMSHWPRPTREF